MPTFNAPNGCIPIVVERNPIAEPLKFEEVLSTIITLCIVLNPATPNPPKNKSIKDNK